MKPKIYSNEELTNIVDNLEHRLKILERKEDEKWAEEVAKKARKIF